MSNKAFQVDFLLAGVEGAELGTATFYAAGTTTLKTIWLDRNKATPAANPYTLDANGRAQLYADGIYKIVIKNAAGSTLHTYDNVSFGLSDGPWVDVAEYASLTAAITAIGSTVTDVLVDSATTLTANSVIPATMRLRLTKKGSVTQSSYNLTNNGIIENAGTITSTTGAFTNGSGGKLYMTGGTLNIGGALSIGGVFESGLYQSFTGAGAVTGLWEAHPEWFGADNTGVADSTSAVHKARDAANRVIFAQGTYKGNFTFYTFQQIQGMGIGRTKLTPNNATDPIVTVLQGSEAYAYIKGLGFKIFDLAIDGGQNHTAADPAGAVDTFTGQHGIRLYGGTAAAEPNSSVGQVLIDHVLVTACGGHGVYLDGTGNTIYSQVAWLKINNSVITWNLGNGVKIHGVVHQLEITGASLIEKNTRGVAKPASETVVNERAQVLIRSTSGAGFPTVHTIHGSTTIQTGDDTFTALAGSYGAAVSIHAGQSVNIENCWLESNDIAVSSTSSVSSGLIIRNNYIKDSETYGVLLSAVSGARISGNYFIQAGTTRGTAIKANPATAANLSHATIVDNKYTNFTTNRNIGSASVGIKTKDYGEEALSARTYSTSGATLTVDLSISKVVYVDLGHNITLTMSNPVFGEIYTIFLTQGTTANTVAWADTIKWSNNGVAPVITATNFRGDCIRFIYRSNSAFYEISRLTNIPA